MPAGGVKLALAHRRTGVKAMFPLITGSPLAGRYTATHSIVVPSASFTCQAANLRVTFF